MADTYPHSPDDRPAVGDRLPEGVRFPDGLDLGPRLEQANRAVMMVYRWVNLHAQSAGERKVLIDQLVYVQDTLTALAASPAPMVPCSPDPGTVRAVTIAALDAVQPTWRATGAEPSEDDLAWTRAVLAVVHPTAPAPQVPGVTRERLVQIVQRVQSQRFTDDDGNDVGTMHSGHAWAGVLLTLNALGIPYSNAPATPCPRCGGIGTHGTVHVRHGNGGGHNTPCPDAPAAPEEGPSDWTPPACPSCGSANPFEVRPPCSRDVCDPDQWHRSAVYRPAAADGGA